MTLNYIISIDPDLWRNRKLFLADRSHGAAAAFCAPTIKKKLLGWKNESVLDNLQIWKPYSKLLVLLETVETNIWIRGQYFDPLIDFEDICNYQKLLPHTSLSNNSGSWIYDYSSNLTLGVFSEKRTDIAVVMDRAPQIEEICNPGVENMENIDNMEKMENINQMS